MITNRPTFVGYICFHTSNASNIVLFTCIKLYRNKGIDGGGNEMLRIKKTIKKQKY